MAERQELPKKRKILYFCPRDGQMIMFNDKYEAEKGFGCRSCGYCDYEYPPTSEEWDNR